ncbi:MAG: tagaturonate epimerase family protein [Bacteroidales bacterium]
MKLTKYSLGMGDRFGHQGTFQLKAIMAALKQGVEITPVWNKSNREHSIIHTLPRDTRIAADEAVKAMNYKGPYFVDADHINMSNVDKFIEHSDFFTIDVADYIGKMAEPELTNKSFEKLKFLIGSLKIPGISEAMQIDSGILKKAIDKYLFAVLEAGKIFRHILEKKGNGNFIAEISMDEVDIPQSPIELYIILALISEEKIPVQTIAPRFTGRFNKGVDYVGDINVFKKEFEEDILVIDFAVEKFGLPENLKLSVHSGSDKFSIYPAIKEILKKHDKGIHIKTAGTTWLEEVIGLALAGGDSLALVKEIYFGALLRMDELCAPYAQVIDIDKSKLPSQEEVKKWEGQKYANTLRHIPENPDYNPNFRQLIHVGYKMAVEHGDQYYAFLEKYPEIVGKQVFENLYNRHLCRLFDLE